MPIPSATTVLATIISFFMARSSPLTFNHPTTVISHLCSASRTDAIVQRAWLAASPAAEAANGPQPSDQRNTLGIQPT